jgi:Flp pilus assembly protein TadB
MNNQETQSKLGTRQERKKTKENQNQNEQSRDTINIGHKTRTKKNKRKTKSRMNNLETQSTLDRRQERRIFLILFFFCFSLFLSCAQC